MTEMDSMVHDTTDQSLEMESGVPDTDQSQESSDTDIRDVPVEDQNPRVNSVDAQIEEFDIAGSKIVTRSDAGDVITVDLSGDMKEELKLPVSDNGETLQLDKPLSQQDSNVERSDHALVHSARSRSLGNGFEMGDMVWGKVKSHPWWPGYIFNAAFTSSSVWRTKKDDQVLVAFFGDSSYGWFDLEELVPYEPHFNEKSQQSTSRNFVKAVEESIDEACRRSALGLTCFCRNPNNFRPTKVPGHIAVDVFDYEPGGIYSTDQIRKSRDNFQPERILSFIEQLAAAPKKATMTLDYMRERAAAVACRRAVFVEFDETYAQAFGHKAVRPVAAPPPTVDQSVQARFSGPLVIAESQSGRKSSTKAAKPREKSKKDRYLFKRRDEPGDTGTCQTGVANPTSLSSSPLEDTQSNPPDEAVLERDQVDGTASARDDEPASSHSLSKAVPGPVKESGHAKPSAERKALGEDKGASKETHTPILKRKKADLSKKSPKKPSAGKSELGEKKKRKTIGSQEEEKQPGEGKIPERPPLQVKDITASLDIPSGTSTDSLPAEKNDGKIEQVVSDLKALAVDPSYGRERNRPKIARHLVLKFRSHVFLKSQAASPPASNDTDTTAKTARPPKPDPTKGEKKRAQSDRQEDVGVKRLKKASALKVEENKKKKPSGPSEIQHPRSVARTEPVKKQAPKVRVEEPTFLVMKYPPGTSLPSSAELKARFARFGPMDTSQMRIFYTTYTCRILYLYKEDAESAFRFGMGNKSAFANVRFMLRSNSEAQPEKPSPSSSSSLQLKSCLKKPGGDEGGGSQSSGARVRFNMAETKTAASGVVKTIDPRTNNNNNKTTSSSLSVAIDVVHNNNNQPETFSKPPLQPPLVPSVETTTRLLPPLPPPLLSLPQQSRQPPVDISQQMLSLLTRCNDVVSDVKSILGYVPYHPL